MLMLFLHTQGNFLEYCFAIYAYAVLMYIHKETSLNNELLFMLMLFLQTQGNFLEYCFAIYAYAVLTYTKKLFMLLNPRLGLTCACNVLYCTMYSVQCTIHLCRVLQSLFFIILLWLIFPALKFSQYLFCRRKKKFLHKKVLFTKGHAKNWLCNLFLNLNPYRRGNVF